MLLHYLTAFPSTPILRASNQISPHIAHLTALRDTGFDVIKFDVIGVIGLDVGGESV